MKVTKEDIGRFTALAMQCIPREYPNKLSQLLSSEEQLRSPKELHPAFFGCYDWHSSVHGHWMLAKALKEFDRFPGRESILPQLLDSISQVNIAGELSYLQQESKSWERMYGWAWLLQLQTELNTWDLPEAASMAEALLPLSDCIRGRYMEFLPIQTYPIRAGVHPNTAFGMAFAYDYAIAANDTEFASLIEETAYRYFSHDEDGPISWEPGGEDFLSPCLEEAALMSRVMPGAEFQPWLSRFLPGLGEANGLIPADVSDRSDPKIAHLDGLNLSRAWNLLIIANAIDNQAQAGRLRDTADRHLDASLPFVTDEHYEGSHWLGSFAIYALTRDR
ncbi:MAG: DUF2891 domain-containing protein [Woeseiaceae bacterium]|nr:DUF2891 domain-containing protein [Woeseiaceae bacterium]